jgi:hypothetical protein
MLNRQYSAINNQRIMSFAAPPRSFCCTVTVALGLASLAAAFAANVLSALMQQPHSGEHRQQHIPNVHGDSLVGGNAALYGQQSHFPSALQHVASTHFAQYCAQVLQHL